MLRIPNFWGLKDQAHLPQFRNMEGVISISYDQNQAIFDLRQLDISLPQDFGIALIPVGAQDVAATVLHAS